jgi:hypothetical protein
MICPQCGKKASGNFCSECGARLAQEVQASPPAAQLDAAATTPPPTTPAEAPGLQAPSAVSPPGAPAATAPSPPSPPKPAASLCPVCRQASLQPTTVRGVLGLHHRPALLCPHCGATLVQDDDDSARFTLTETHDRALAGWQTYAHKTLSVDEWQRIAAGGASDAEQTELDLGEAMSALRRGQVTAQPFAPAPVLLKSGGGVLFCIPDVTLREPRAVTTGGYGGPSIHVATGITLRAGAFRAQSHEELKDVDSGTLVLTTKRLVFAGALCSLEVDLAKLVSVDAYADALAIRRTGKERTEFFFGLDHYRYEFTVEGRHHIEPFSGLIIKYAIEGLLNPATD